MPHRINLMAQVPLTPAKAGHHTVVATVSIRDTLVEWQRRLLVEIEGT